MQNVVAALKMSKLEVGLLFQQKTAPFMFEATMYNHLFTFFLNILDFHDLTLTAAELSWEKFLKFRTI